MDDLSPSVEIRGDAKAGFEDDVWIPTSCATCLCSCSILVHRVNGVIVKIEGNPESAVGKGRLCGKGVSSLMTHYDPNRLRVPLRRTNPKKGIGIDPGWQEISWDQALDEIAGHLKRIRADDPRKLTLQRTTTLTGARLPFGAFAAGFGTPNMGAGGASLHCGNGSHFVCGVMHASWTVHTDFQYCNYTINFGTNSGFGSGTLSTSNMKLAADARDRGMKLVVVDPVCNFAAAKANEWVPVRVGTDAALALAMCNVIVNELGIIDAPYLKAKTNGPYLIGPDKAYVRDPETNAPMVWDERAAAARPFDQTAPEDMALEGSFTVNGVPCRPAFDLLREHLKTYTPERGEEITTVPAANIRRIAGELATEARVGSTIVIDGVTLPYRPVAAVAFRGAQGHKNSVPTFAAIALLNHLLGAADVVGSSIGVNPVCDGFPETGRLRYAPSADADGLMETGSWVIHHHPYPVGDPALPQVIGLQDLFPMSMITPFTDSSDSEELWQKFDFPYRPEMMINHGANLLMSIANKDIVAESLAKYKFIVSFELFLTETTDFADIVLPDCDNLQSFDSRSNYPFITSLPAGMGEWCWPIRQPVVEPDGEQRRFADVICELADRAGFLADYNAAFNASLELQPPYRLDPESKYTYEQICDAELKNTFGAERDLAWFREHGVIKWPKKPEEVYWRPFQDVRVPIYYEWMTAVGEKIAAIAEPRGMDIPLEYYDPLPNWLPCPSHECHDPDFDLYAFYSRDTIHTHSFTVENPWLDEVARLDPYSYTVVINTDVGRRKGLANGDPISIETETGRRITGRIRLSEGIHPEALGVAVLGGHWSDGLPVAKAKGAFFNELLELDWRHSDPIALNMDLCVKVKITPLAGVS
ncbi:MAG: molybdopterin-dependent oxidoreductase [Rhodospirillales bacterium]|mgnify:CR=1 FL=1|jgi:molybdopterin-containing oxidoreductase family molybdopterin binding subunit|nr:molybdopterin-dependent oxidoreductase [Rhodospirillales bacterium]MDP6842834.1 molybdopterin-dependent oxidoreductase [Rhodospirillales bacterium]